MLDVHLAAKDQAQKRLDKALQPVDERLHEWGKFTKNGSPFLGFPTQASHLQIRIDGAKHAATEIPKEILEVDAAVARLSNMRQKVIAVAYMHFPGLPPDFQRRKVKMSKYKWNATLRECRLIIGTILGYDFLDRELNPNSQSCISSNVG